MGLAVTYTLPVVMPPVWPTPAQSIRGKVSPVHLTLRRPILGCFFCKAVSLNFWLFKLVMLGADQSKSANGREHNSRTSSCLSICSFSFSTIWLWWLISPSFGERETHGMSAVHWECDVLPIPVKSTMSIFGSIFSCSCRWQCLKFKISKLSCSKVMIF